MRLDRALVARDLAPSRARAQAMIAAGAVRVNGALVTKPSTEVDAGDRIDARDPNPWVSRGALKLVHALDHFGLTPGGTALDIGASTGGFTEVLLARGAGRVHALDVGHGQLAPLLRADERVTVHEGVNARELPPVGPLDWIVADVSFISLALVLPPAMAQGAPGAHLVALVKPQFEVGPSRVGKGGVVRDALAQASAVAGVARMLEAAGWPVTGTTPSPIEGGDGNREWLIAARRA